MDIITKTIMVLTQLYQLSGVLWLYILLASGNYKTLNADTHAAVLDAAVAAAHYTDMCHKIFKIFTLPL